MIYRLPLLGPSTAAEQVLILCGFRCHAVIKSSPSPVPSHDDSVWAISTISFFPEVSFDIPCSRVGPSSWSRAMRGGSLT